MNSVVRTLAKTVNLCKYWRMFMENKLLLIKEYHSLLNPGDGNVSHVPHLCSEEPQHQPAQELLVDDLQDKTLRLVHE